MSAALCLAGPDDLDRLAALVAACHAEQGVAQDDDTRRAGLAPLLEGSPHGCVYLIGPKRAPVGYVVITFGWSVEFGGLDGVVESLYIRPPVRGRGIAAETLLSLGRSLGSAGMRALHLHAPRDGDDAARRLFDRIGFTLRDRSVLMSKRL